MPRLLYRYMVNDLLRIVGLTATVLVVVIAFGAALKPLAGGALLDAGQTIKYIGLAIVPMLQYALPFAAGFGATLCLHRMTSENEVQAMAAAGISYRRILIPIAAIGLALMIVMVMLTQWIVPRFFGVLEQLIAADVTKIFANAIERGEPFQHKDLQIYADDIIIEHDLGPDGPAMRMRLLKVAAAELDAAGRIRTDVTGKQAVIDVYRRDGRTLLKLAMIDTVAFNPTTGHLAQSDRIEPSRAIVISDILGTKPKTLTRGQLLALRSHPDEFADVIHEKRLLAQAIHNARARIAIDRQFDEHGSIEMVGQGLGDDAASAPTYRITAKRLRGEKLTVREGERIIVVQHEHGQPVRQITSQAARMTAVGDSIGLPAFDLLVSNCDVTELQGRQTTNQRTEISIPNLALPSFDSEEYGHLPSTRLIDRAEAIGGQTGGIREHIDALRRAIQRLHNQINGQLVGRYVLSITAFLLPLLGATLAMWRRASPPLTTYIWAFAPAIANLILVSAGDQLLRDGRNLGYLIMWSGIVLMCGALIGVYWRLARN